MRIARSGPHLPAEPRAKHAPDRASVFPRNYFYFAPSLGINSMSLGPGSKIGSLRIESLIGRGGMGEVFRARDTRLHREVAIKILPDDFATDADRLHRFEQESKTLASLNDPNILTIHDVGAC